MNSLFQFIKIENISNSKDTLVLQNALNSQNDKVDVHHAGTAMRFLTSYFAIQEGKNVVLTGSDRMKQRPIKPLVDALRELGATIEYEENEGFPPLKIYGKKIVKSNVSIPANISSQFITSLMLIGAKLENGLKIMLQGKITSKPYIEMTLRTLKSAGIEAKFEEDIITVLPINTLGKSSHIIHFEVESDWSSASYYYELAAIGRKNITLRNFENNSLQADSVIKEIFLENFGINTIFDAQEHLITLIPEPIQFPQKIVLDMNHCPDIAQTVCVTAAALKIHFEIKGLETLKIKETDRLSALKNELVKIGCITEISDSSIASVKYFEPFDHIHIITYDDHRMAMSFAPFCLVKDMQIQNPEVVEKSYPKFWEDFNKIVKEI